MATALIATALSVVGCKKEEKAKEAAPAPVQTAAPAQQAAAPAPKAGVASYDFESSVNGWGSTDKAVNIARSGEVKHAGNFGLKVAGKSGEKLYNFAVSPKFPLEPGKKYKLTGWMLVQSVEDAKLPPILKCGTYQDGKWVANAFTKKYALAKKGEWQELSTTFEAPKGDKVTGMVSVEKGDAKANTATLFLDDIQVAPLQ